VRLATNRNFCTKHTLFIKLLPLWLALEKSTDLHSILLVVDDALPCWNDTTQFPAVEPHRDA